MHPRHLAAHLASGPKARQSEGGEGGGVVGGPSAFTGILGIGGASLESSLESEGGAIGGPSPFSGGIMKIRGRGIRNKKGLIKDSSVRPVFGLRRGRFPSISRICAWACSLVSGRIEYKYGSC